MDGTFSGRALDFFKSISFLDWVGIVLFFTFVFLGLFRGAGWQFRRFLGILVAIVAARFVAPLASPTVNQLLDPKTPRLGLAISYLFLFAFTLAFLALVFHFLKPKVSLGADEKKAQEAPKAGKKSKHRLLGGFFGMFTAMELYTVLIVSIFLFNSEIQNKRITDQSYGAAFTARLVHLLGKSFPLEVHQSVVESVKPEGK